MVKLMLLTSIILGFIWSTIISHWGASILLHRYYCHKQFKVPKWFEAIGLFMLMIACIRTPIGWIASHRMHHAYSDTEKDPHSPIFLGKWKVLTTTWTLPEIKPRFARDLFRNPMLKFTHHYWLHILIAVWIISFLISPYFFIGFALIPFIHAKVGFGLLNTYCHIPKPNNRPWLNLLVAGEGYHKNHHDDGKRIRLAKWDTGGWIAEKLFKN
jgi:stearoyl-CoA desaturase (delta-9 desaturase)